MFRYLDASLYRKLGASSRSDAVRGTGPSYRAEMDAALSHGIFDPRITARRLVVAGQPRGHREELFDSDAGESGSTFVGSCAGRSSPTVWSRLVISLGQGNPNQRADEALGDRSEVMAGRLIPAVPVVFVDQIAVAHDQHAAYLGVALCHLVFDYCQPCCIYPRCIFGAARHRPSVSSHGQPGRLASAPASGHGPTPIRFRQGPVDNSARWPQPEITHPICLGGLVSTIAMASFSSVVDNHHRDREAR